MPRPTIRMIAATAGVSVATVNRYVAGSGSVRVSMRNRIDAAINSIGQGERPPSIAPQIYRLGFVLPSPGQLYGQPFADALRSAAHVSNAPIDVRIAHVEISSPLTAADLVRSMSAECHAISVTAALCPSLTDAIE